MRLSVLRIRLNRELANSGYFSASCSGERAGGSSLPRPSSSPASLARHQAGGVCLRNVLRGVRHALAEPFRHGEEPLRILRIGGIEDAERFIDSGVQRAGNLICHSLVAAGLEQIVDDVERIGDQLLVQRGQQAAAEPVFLAGSIRLRDVFHIEDGTAAVRRTAPADNRRKRRRNRRRARQNRARIRGCPFHNATAAPARCAVPPPLFSD